MQLSEKHLSDSLRKFLEDRGAKTEKLHGNLYQWGLPDILVGLPDGTIVLIETKWTRAYSIRVSDVWKMLRPGQRRIFLTWKDYPVYVCVANARGMALILAEEFSREDRNLELVSMKEAVGPLVNDYD